METCDQDGQCERVAGDDRYKTSVAVAEKFFPDGADCAVLAYANNFPDGLAGGPLAISIKAPLLLVSSSEGGYSAAVDYAKRAGIKKAVVLGGKTLITDLTVNKILP
jgi:putative cell wall-binding protein